MKCPNHSSNDTVGYCVICAEFGCPECLFEHEGALLCARHYRPVAQKLEEQKKHEEQRKRHQRQRLVAHYLDGHCEYGMSYAMSLRDSTFHLYLVDSEGMPREATQLIHFKDLKAVFLVKSFDGKFDKTLKYKEWAPEGHELVVKFRDQEAIRGFSLHRYDPDTPRFHLIPSDTATNNVSVVVERTAVEGVYTPEEYLKRLEVAKQGGPGAGEMTLSQEETTGDFYYETRNYQAAYENYRQAAAKHPHVKRLVKKLFFTQYNLGVTCIKQRDYPKALSYMEGLLKVDPNNARVQKKVLQLRHIISRPGGTLNLSDD